MPRPPKRAPARARPLPKPSPAGAAALGPWARTRLTSHALGRSLSFDVPADVFSTQRIDEGTQLLLGHLPAREPASFLDLGCGYGALGLPVAARFPEARAWLVDRDLLAVRACAHNARALGLANVRCLPSLGYRDLPEGAAPFDWILCNVPARIGAAAIGALLARGQRLLAAEGELRAVVIRDLVETVEAEGRERGLGARLVSRGPRHAVFALGRAQGPAAAEPEVYARDEVVVEAAEGPPLRLSRPHDVSEDPGHPRALRTLLSLLPRAQPARALVFRCGYGALPLALRARAPQALVVAQDRDLLETEFLRRNARALGLGGDRLRVVEALSPSEAAGPGETFDLVLGELSAAAGPEVAALELLQAHALLSPGGSALVLLSSKQRRDWLPRIVPPGSAGAVLLDDGTSSVLRLSRGKIA